MKPSVPRISVYSMASWLSPVSRSAAVRRAASITPPVAPKMTAAPVETPMASSNFSSGRRLKFSWAFLIRRASSRVVMEMSTSGTPLASSFSRPISNFLAVQGMTDTHTMSWGSRPIFCA